MKKFFLLMTALLAAGWVSAQDSFSFGPKVGINISDIYIDADGIEESAIRGVKPALVIGGFAEYRFIPKLSVSAEVLYSRQGSQSDQYVHRGNPHFGQKNSSYEHEYTLQYLNIPVLVNFYITEGLAIKAGIQPGFLLGADFQVDIDAGGQQQSQKWSIKNDLRSFDLAIPMGLSYTFNYGFFLDARYNLALSDILGDDAKAGLELEGVTYHKMKNRVFAISVGWKF